MDQSSFNHRISIFSTFLTLFFFSIRSYRRFSKCNTTHWSNSHCCSLDDDPAQALSSSFSHCRVLVLIPMPHVTGQSPQLDQFDQVGHYIGIRVFIINFSNILNSKSQNSSSRFKAYAAYDMHMICRIGTPS